MKKQKTKKNPKRKNQTLIKKTKVKMMNDTFDEIPDVSWSALTLACNDGSFDSAILQEAEEYVGTGNDFGSVKLSPSLLGGGGGGGGFATPSKTLPVTTEDLMATAQSHFAKLKETVATETIPASKSIESEIPIPTPLPQAGNGMEIDPVQAEEEGDLDDGVVTTSPSNSGEDEENMQIDQGSSIATADTVMILSSSSVTTTADDAATAAVVAAGAVNTATKTHADFLYSSEDDESSASNSSEEEEEEEVVENGTNDNGTEVEEEGANDASYSEDNSSSSSSEEEDDDDGLAGLSGDAYEEELWKAAQGKEKIKKTERKLETSFDFVAGGAPKHRHRPAKKAAKKEIKKRADKLKLIERMGGIKDADLGLEAAVKNVKETVVGLDDDDIPILNHSYTDHTASDVIFAGGVEQRGVDTEFKYDGDDAEVLKAATEQRQQRVMRKFTKELEKTITVFLERCDKEKSRDMLTAFHGICLKLRQDLPVDYELALHSPAKEKAKQFLYVNPAEFMKFKACLGDMLYERLKKVQVQKSNSRKVDRPDLELLACFQELKLTSPGDFIEMERNLFVRAIAHRCCKITPRAGTNGEYNNIVMRHPFYKFWEEIGKAVEIRIRTVVIKENFETENLRCAMTGQELTVGQSCFSLTYTCPVENGDEDDDSEIHYETRAMFLCYPVKPPTSDYPRMDIIAYASFSLLNIREYIKERCIDWWIKKRAYVPKTQGIQKCMAEFVSGPSGLMATTQAYYEYKLMGSLLDRFVPS